MIKPVKCKKTNKFMWIEEENFDEKQHVRLSIDELEQRYAEKTNECLNLYRPVFLDPYQLQELDDDGLRRYVASCIIDPRSEANALDKNQLVAMIIEQRWFEGGEDALGEEDEEGVD